MFVHLIQFDVSDGLDLGLLDGGAHVTLGLSSSSRLWARFFRGSGEHPVDTSGDLKQRQEVYKLKKKKKKKKKKKVTRSHQQRKSTHRFLQTRQLLTTRERCFHQRQTELMSGFFAKTWTWAIQCHPPQNNVGPPLPLLHHSQWLFFLCYYFYFRCLTGEIVPVWCGRIFLHMVSVDSCRVSCWSNCCFGGFPTPTESCVSESAQIWFKALWGLSLKGTV